MPKRLIYLPLEPYAERYTMQLSAPETGWMERNWRKVGLNYLRIDTHTTPRKLESGVVLDPFRRSHHAMSQITQLLILLEEGLITNDDAIYFEDFWHPGVEALKYALHVKGVRPKMYAFLWAQSIDCYDFTHPMKSWIRNFECGIANCMDGIFVASTLLRDKLIDYGIANYGQVHVVGLPFDSQEVMSRTPHWYQNVFRDGPTLPRKDQVVFSSRWDAEKQPGFFMGVAWEVFKRLPNTKFVICTSAPKLRSNDSALLDALNALRATLPHNVELREGLTKEAYYATLCESKVQFNGALQDWVSFTLLEASVCGCWPVYPNFRSFPETLDGDWLYLYRPWEVSAAADKVVTVLQQNELWNREAIHLRSWIHKRFDDTWVRMLRVMDFAKGDGLEHDLPYSGKTPYEGSY